VVFHDRVVQHVRIAIERLWVAGSGHNAVRLQKPPDISAVKARAVVVDTGLRAVRGSQLLITPAPFAKFITLSPRRALQASPKNGACYPGSPEQAKTEQK